MGVNDAAVHLEVAKREVVRLEKENADLRNELAEKTDRLQRLSTPVVVPQDLPLDERGKRFEARLREIHPDFRVKMYREAEFGTTRWMGSLYEYANIVLTDQAIKQNIGDTVFDYEVDAVVHSLKPQFEHGADGVPLELGMTTIRISDKKRFMVEEIGVIDDQMGMVRLRELYVLDGEEREDFIIPMETYERGFTRHGSGRR